MVNIHRVVTFYSYKGGVGRSMAMANIAALLSQWGYKTLVIDWDLEAPGLENFFYKDQPREIDKVIKKKGLIDLLCLKQENLKTKVDDINWDEYVTTLPTNKNLDFISAGRRDDNYITKVKQFDFTNFYKEFDGGQYLEDLREHWIEKYNFVLIDSRTGLTDSSGICSIHMPDILILLFTPNEQSFNGIKNVSKKAIEGQKKILFDRFRLRTLPVPSRIENAETAELDKWMKRIYTESTEMLEWLPRTGEKFDKYLITPEELLNQIKIPYKTLYAYGERLPVIDRGTSDPQDIGYTYETLAAIIAMDFQEIDRLVGSRDVYVKKAKHEEVNDDTDFRKQLKDLVEDKEKRKKYIRGWVITMVSLFVFAFIIGGVLEYFEKAKSEKNYVTFINSLKGIQKMTSDSKRDSICNLSNYKNDFNDDRITTKKDSLIKVCNEIDKVLNNIALNSNSIIELESLATDDVKVKAGKLDSIDYKIYMATEKANGDSSKIKPLLSEFQTKMQKIISGDSVLSKIEKRKLVIAQASHKLEDSLQIKKDKDTVTRKTTWFKEGYYLIFNEVKILLKAIDVKNREYIDVEITGKKPTSKSEKWVVIKEKQRINILDNKPFVFKYNDTSYEIQLDHIGRAGHNPFNLAAYVIVTPKYYAH